MLQGKLIAWHTANVTNGEGEAISDHPTFINESERQGDEMEL